MKRIYVILLAIFLLVVSNACNTQKLMNNVEQDHKQTIESSKNENKLNNNQNSQNYAIKNSDNQPNKSFYGEWEVIKILAYAQIYAEEEAKGFIGTKLRYQADFTRSGDAVLKEPFYKQTIVSKDDFESGNRVTFKNLGIEGNSIVKITVHKDSVKEYDWKEVGSYFYIKNNNTLIIPAGGKFFEVVRTQ
ncbi:MAG: hypothetical protein WA118_13485 [Carboxydocellales bacterium]